jgi:hypothetical protein
VPQFSDGLDEITGAGEPPISVVVDKSEETAVADVITEVRKPQIAMMLNESDAVAVAEEPGALLESANKKPCLRVDGNSFAFHGNNINFQSSK